MTSDRHESHFHGPANAEHEIKKAYREVVDAGITHFWNRRAIPGVAPFEAVALYRESFETWRRGERLAAERLARATKQLARALTHEARIAYLAPRTGELPSLEGAAKEYGTQGRGPEETRELLDSVALGIPAEDGEMAESMR